MKRILKYIFISLACFMVFNTNTTATVSGTLGSLRQELNDLKRKKSNQDKKTAKTKNEIAATKNSIFSSQETIKQNQKKIDDAKIEITKLNIEIAQLQETLKDQMNIEQATKGENIYLDYIFNSKSYADLVYRYAIAEQVANHRTEKVTNWNQKIEQNKELEIELVEKEKEIKQELEKLEKEVVYLGEEYEKESDVAMSIQDEVKSTQEYITYLVDLGCGENEDIMSCINLHGDRYLRKPLVKGRITSPFGYRVHPITGVKQSYHNAIDIGGNTEGTNIYSAANGIVGKIINASMSDPKCGGRQVYVHHNIAGKLYTTAYYHLLNIKVKLGDEVTSNTVIGTVGGGKGTPWDGCSTGAHLHFVVAEGWYGGTCKGDCYLNFNTFKYTKSVDPKKILNLPNSWSSR